MATLRKLDSVVSEDRLLNISLAYMSQDEILCVTSHAIVKGQFLPRYQAEPCRELPRNLLKSPREGSLSRNPTSEFVRDTIEKLCYSVWFFRRREKIDCTC